MMSFPVIDYAAHPAYAKWADAIEYDSDHVGSAVAKADSASQSFNALGDPSKDAAADALATIRAAFGEIVRHARQQKISSIADEWLQLCLDWSLNDFRYEFLRRIYSAREYRSKSLNQSEREQLQRLRDTGMYVAQLDPGAYAEIRRHALKLGESLRKVAYDNPLERAVLNVAYNSPIWRVLRRALEDAKVFDVLSEFKKNSMTLLGAGLEFSHSRQMWYQNVYSDVHLEPSPLQYLHYDEGDCLPKSMIYINPVDKDHGPTRVIPESNSWASSETCIRVHRALDRLIGDRYTRVTAGGSYRPVARSADLRRVFMELPPMLRGSSHFGDDILAGSDVDALLRPREFSYLSKGEQTLVFDGPHVLHRGSLVSSGERLSLQVVYRNRNEARIRSEMANQNFRREQLALLRRYARRYVMEYA